MAGLFAFRFQHSTRGNGVAILVNEQIETGLGCNVRCNNGADHGADQTEINFSGVITGARLVRCLLVMA